MERKTLSANKAVVTEAPLVEAKANATSPNPRQMVFRCVRLTLAGVLVSCSAMYARTVFLTPRSEQAYINAEITALRAPIAGQIRLEPLEPGRVIRAGSQLFAIENARFGNEQAVSQLNWVTELAQRLQAESDEAAVRLRRQEEVTRLHEKMFAEQIIPRMELVEEQAKLELAATVLTNKLVLAKKAAERVTELTIQAELQQSASVKMPFDGIAWTVPAKQGAQIAVNETVMEMINPHRMWVDAYFAERHGARLIVGSEVNVETPQGKRVARGRIETVRAGVGRIAFEGVAAVSSSEYAPRRVAVRVRLESQLPFEASQFFGVGQSVVVTLNTHE